MLYTNSIQHVLHKAESFILNRPLVAVLSNGKVYPPREGRYVIVIARTVADPNSFYTKIR